jgi:hypothetical protein
MSELAKDFIEHMKPSLLEAYVLCAAIIVASLAYVFSILL